jgi:hypothetical protein
MSPALLQYHMHSMHSNQDKRLKSNAAKNATRIKNNKDSISTNSNSSNCNSNSNKPLSSYFMDTLGLGITWL